jgi:putative ABC transport system ATP-binding protein
VLVTHDRDVAGRARRQIVMRDGLIVPDPVPEATP